MFDISPEERQALAAQLRSSTIVETIITPDMEAELDRVTVTERHLPSRAGPTRVLIIEPREGTAPRPLFINMHGGGFVRGYHRRDTIFCATVAAELGCTVIDVDYRLAPEHPFPTALHECYDVTAWAFEHAAALSVDPQRIAIGGHSAGGNLATAVCLMANRSGAFRCRGQVLDYPFLDGVTPPEKKLEPHSIFPAERLHAFNALYARVPGNLSDPLLSPVMAQRDLLAGLPPAMLIVAGLDPLRFEAHRYAAMLVEAGVDVTVRQFLDCDHGFLVAGHARHAEGRAAIADWLRGLFAS